jgi:superfamily II DNA or RNA helicase
MMVDSPVSSLNVTIDTFLNDLDLHLRRDAEDAALRAVGHKVEYLFAVDVPATREEGALVVRLLARVRRPDGTWDKPTPAIAGPDEALAAAPTDRRLLAALLGATRNDAEVLDDATVSYTRFTLPGALALEWVPLAARAGRLILRETAASSSIRPLQWDDGPAWRFTLDIHEDDEGHWLSGVLTRREDRLNVTDPVLLLEVGLLFTHERVAACDHGPSFGVLSAMRERGALLVPTAQTSRLARVLNRFGVDAETLPDALKLVPLRVAPSARLRLSPLEPVPDPLPGVEAPPAETHVDATLSFDYDGTHVPATPAETFFDADRQRIIHRDAEAEREAHADLLALDGQRTNLNDPSAWRLPAKGLSEAVRTLVRDGWRIDAGGVPYKAPGPARLSVTSGIDWFDLTAIVPFGDTTATLVELLAALRRGEKTITLGDGTVGMLPDEWLRRYAPLAAAGIENEDGTIRYKPSQAALLDAMLDAQSAHAEIQVDEAFARLRERLATFDHAEAIDPPATFTGTLRSYQREGLGWIQFLRHFGFGGCLADDMGLGKTVTVLAELARVADVRQALPASERGPRPSLVVVPRSVVHNWKDEAAKFTPMLRVLDYSSGERRTAESRLTDYDIVLVTYGTVRRDIDVLKDVEFEYVILDEAQTIKNAATVASRAVRLLKSRYRLALSGTPLENHLGELWSLFEFLNPGLLGKSSMFQRATSASRPDADAVALVARGLKPFLLRRTKAQVATELPARTEQTLTCVLTPRERGFYDALRRHYRTSLMSQVSKVGVSQSGLQILEALLRLRQAACHPGLVSEARQGDPSSKLDLLLENLREVVDEGHKALVFSQFTSLLALVRPMLDKAKITYEYLDGRTRDRAERVARFQEDPNCPVFLVSLKAGGVGLNLTAADYVFLLDPWWNPAVEAQAIDRTHRIGQTKEVFAYRLIAEDTVEEKVVALQQNKRALADAVLTANPVGLRGLSRDDLELLLS